MLPEEIIEKRILISVLNWGMGHVSRSIGLIQQLLKQENKVIIACSFEQEKIYRQYFESVDYVSHEGYPFKFDGKGKFGNDLMKQFSPLKKRLLKEIEEVDLLIEKYKIDFVISDHRYGFRTQKIPSIFITHQYNLPIKWYEFTVDLIHKKLMKKFDEIWIMDYKDSKLAGKLSKSNNEMKVSYIGPYSRFSLYGRDNYLAKYDNVLIASGPRIYAQGLVDDYFSNNSIKEVIVICEQEIKLPEGVIRISDDWKSQDQYILSTLKLTSRSGYSTIMDLEFLKCESELIPTPGQVEQEYLASIKP